MDQSTRQLMTTHKALHPRDHIDRVYVSKKGGGGLASIEDCVDTSKQEIKIYIKKSKERLIKIAKDTFGNIQKKQQTRGKRNGKKNNCMDILSDKLTRLHAKRHVHS